MSVCAVCSCCRWNDARLLIHTHTHSLPIQLALWHTCNCEQHIFAISPVVTHRLIIIFKQRRVIPSRRRFTRQKLHSTQNVNRFARFVCIHRLDRISYQMCIMCVAILSSVMDRNRDAICSLRSFAYMWTDFTAFDDDVNDKPREPENKQKSKWGIFKFAWNNCQWIC